jgi:uncharacterized protein (UPF0335 family)
MPRTREAAPARAREEFVARIVRLHRKRDEIADEIADIYAEARDQGFEANELRALVVRQYERRDRRRLPEGDT